MRQRRYPLLRTIALNVIVHALALGSLVPFLWLICAAFKEGSDLFSSVFLPWHDLGRLTLSNFAKLFREQPFLTWLINSTFLASTQTVLSVVFSSLGGFALAKYRFRGNRLIMLLMLSTLLLPVQVLLPGSYELIYGLGWINSYAAIVVPGAISVFGMFLYRQAMLGVPNELLQAARVDGASELRLWWNVAMPIVRPMTAAFMLLSFLGSWNSFLWPQIVLQDESKYTLPIGLSNMMGLSQYQTEYGVLMAGTLMSILPVIGLFFVLQRDFIAGLTSGAVKA